MAKMLSGGVALSTPAAQTRLAALAAQPVRAALYYDSTVARPGMDKRQGQAQRELAGALGVCDSSVLQGITGYY